MDSFGEPLNCGVSRRSSSARPTVIRRYDKRIGHQRQRNPARAAPPCRHLLSILCLYYPPPHVTSLDEAHPDVGTYVYAVAAHRASIQRSDLRDPLPLLAVCH